MKRLTLDDLDRAWREVESVLDQTPEIDRWCSGPDWVIPVHLGFGNETEPLILSAEDGFALLARYRLADGRSMLAGMEPLWGFASPILGADVPAVVERLAAELDDDRSWDVLVLPGMPPPPEPTSFTTNIVRGLGSLGTVRVGEGITRQVADLRGGYDTWLGRRTSRFRRNLRQATERAESQGLSYHDISDADDAFERLLAIERLTWKGAEESGITSVEMTTTYRVMVARLQARRRLRVHVARAGGQDVGYILGGVRGRRYRGLQLSYVAEAAELSVGHLLQRHQLQLLCDSDEADSYDLGMDFDYKRRWADAALTSYTLVIER